MAQMVKNPPAIPETWVQSLVWEDPLEKGMATHSGRIAWRIPQTKESGRLQFIELQRVGHGWAISTFTVNEMIMWFLSFILLTWCIMLIDLCLLNHPCIPGINATWWCCMIFFNILSNVVCYYCLKNICTYIYLEYWPIIFFLEVFNWLWYYSNTGLIRWAWESSLICNFLEEFENRHKFFKVH